MQMNVYQLFNNYIGGLIEASVSQDLWNLQNKCYQLFNNYIGGFDGSIKVEIYKAVYKYI
jgi:hypothetical protein